MRHSPVGTGGGAPGRRQRPPCSPVERGSLWSRCPHRSPRRTPHQSRWIFLKELRPLEIPHVGAGEKYERERAAERNCEVLTVPPASLGNWGWVAESGDSGKARGKMLLSGLSFSFCFSPPISILIGNKLSSFSHRFDHKSNW